MSPISSTKVWLVSKVFRSDSAFFISWVEDPSTVFWRAWSIC